jgi:hypothetical protein
MMALIFWHQEGKTLGPTGYVVGEPFLSLQTQE